MLLKSPKTLEKRNSPKTHGSTQELARRQRREIAKIEQERAAAEAEIDEQSRIGEGFVDEVGLNKPCHAGLRQFCLRLRPLEHRQFPVSTRFIEFQDVQGRIVAPDFDVTVIRPVPLIERFDDFDPTAVEMKRQEHRRAVVISMEFDLNAHGLCPMRAAPDVAATGEPKVSAPTVGPIWHSRAWERAHRPPG